MSKKPEAPETVKPAVQHPTVGRIVLFRLKAKNGVVTRPAIVVHVFERTDGEVPLVNLQVFTDDSNDGLPGVAWATSAKHDADQSEGSWHWMPYQTAQAKKPDELAALVKQLEELTAQVESQGKSHKATAKVVEKNLRNYTKVQPRNIHEAIQRLKAEGSALVGSELRQAAGEKFLDWKPKPKPAAPAPAPATTP